MREIIRLFCFSIMIVVFSCSSKPSAPFAAYEMSKICSGQKSFFKSKGRYGTLSELRSENLVVGDKRNYDDIKDGEVHGYIFEIVIKENGYFAKAKPKDETIEKTSFYVDDKSENVKVSFNGKNADSDSQNYQGQYDGQFSCKE